MKTIEQILTEQRSIVDGAADRNLTDDEAAQYETLEGELRAAQRTEEIRKRQEAYEAPNASLAAVVNVGTVRQEDGLDVAFRSYLMTGQANADLAELRAQGTITGASGGYIAPESFRDKIVEVQKSYGGVAAYAETLPTPTGTKLTYASNDDTGNIGQITPESASVSGGADLELGQVELDSYKYTSSGANNAPLRVSAELLQDARNVEAFVAKKLGERIGRKQAHDWAIGTGTGMPDGICRAGLTPDHELAAGTTITYADLLDLEAELDPAYEQNARWIFNKATWTAIRKLEDDNGRPLIFDSAAAGLGGAPGKILLGYPVVLDSYFPGPVGDATNFAVLGDIAEAYAIRRVGQLVIARSDDNRLAEFEVEFAAMERADGTIQNRSAMVVLSTKNV